jgi:hypothetical protein
LSAATRKRHVRTAVAIRRNEASLAAEGRIETDGTRAAAATSSGVFPVLSGGLGSLIENLKGPAVQPTLQT